MTQDEYNAALTSGAAKVEAPENSDSGPSAQASPHADDQAMIDEFIPMLVALQGTQKYLSAAPTFIPQTFQDQIQFVFDGTNYSVYFYFNNQWQQVTGVTGVQSLVAGSGITLTPAGGTGVVTISSSGPPSAIARDASSTATALGGATSFNISHTCTGNNRLLIVGIVGHIVTTDLITGVTYAGVAMNRLSASINFGATSESFWIYYLLAPSTGTNNITITCSSNPGAGGGGLYVANGSYTGVLQAGFPEAQGDNSNGSSTSQIFPGTAGSSAYGWGIAVCGGQNPPLSLQAASGNGSVTNKFADATRCFIADTNGSINPPTALTTGVSGGGGALFVKSIFIGHS